MDNSEKSTIAIFVLTIFSLCAGAIIIFNSCSHEEYNVPFYISKPLQISKGNDTWTITGELKNLTNEDLILKSISFECNGKANNTRYTANYNIKEIIIPANGKVSIYENNLESWLDTHFNKYAELSDVNFKSCTINGISYNPKYSSDGINFHDSNISYGIISLIAGFILLAIGLVKVKNEYF